MLLALALPFAGIAIASHSGNNSHDLQVITETSENQTGTTHTLTAWVPDCFNSSGTNTDTCNVDFEVESGPAIFVVKSQLNQGSTIDDGDTELTPDMSCTVDENRPDDPETAGNESTQEICSVQFTAGSPGTNVIRAWVDEGGNTSADADPTEGRNAGASDCVTTPPPGALNGAPQVPTDPAGACGDPGTPGDEQEVDDTDVVSKTWVNVAIASLLLDCDDASGQSANDPTQSDNDVNQPGVGEVYTCRAWNTASGGSPASGFNIDAEVAAAGGGDNGANDPDARGFNNVLNTTADFDNACVTGPDGTCTFTFNPSQNATGTADLCFWIDQDNDNQYTDVNAATTPETERDGAECDTEGVNDGETANGNRGDDATDVVRKTWGAAGPALLDLEPENDANVTGSTGTQHSVTATVLDNFGNPSANTPVDFVIDSPSRNDVGGTTDRIICDNRLTNAQGQATCTYTDEGTTTDPITFGQFETDVITACLDTASTPGAAAACTTPEAAQAPELNDAIDTVEKYWYLQIPTTQSLSFDVDANDVYASLNCTDTTPETTDTMAVGGVNVVCARVLDANNNPIAGKDVTFTITGTGVFFDDRDQDQIKDAGEPELGKSVVIGADRQGDSFATIWSNTTGNSTVTATSDSQTRTATKTWAAGEARRIECPADATNVPGTTHIIRCTVTDRNSNPVGGVAINATETGGGTFVNCPTFSGLHYGTTSAICQDTSDAQGLVEFQITSATEGTQTVEAAVASDANDGSSSVADRGNAGSNPADTNNACDARADEGFGGGNTQGVNSDPGAPAGQCFDTFVKTWSQDPQPDCDDGIDNDGDGLIDFPDDPGCESAADDSEFDSDVPVECGSEGVIAGTDGPDVLTGTEGDDVICGFGGDDTINGLGGDDAIFGGGGNDEIDGGEGADSIEGDVVAACIETGCADGRDTIHGGGGKDTIRGHGGNDLLTGGNKNDLMVGNAGNDVMRGQNGWDTIRGNAGDDTLVGNAGNDILQGGTGNDLARGGAGDDTIRGFTGRDNLRGGGGNDIIKGAGGRDTLRGGRGDDIMDGGAGRDACFGGPGNDVLRRCE